MAKNAELADAPVISGVVIVFGLLTLTAIVGSLFIILGPKATEKSPGILHVGIRYSDELSVNFLRYGKKGPGARIEFVDEMGTIPHSVDNLIIGRNLVPLVNLEKGSYIIRVSANDYQTIEIPMISSGRMLNPPEGITFEKGIYADYNMIGVRFQPALDEIE